MGCNPYGIFEIRYLQEGGYCIAGVRMDKVQGSSLKEKIARVCSEPGAIAFTKDAMESGFCCWHDEPGQLVVIPPGHIILMMGTWSADGPSASVGIRYGFMHNNSKADVEVCKNTAKEMMATYDHLKSELSEWIKVIDNFVLPLTPGAA